MAIFGKKGLPEYSPEKTYLFNFKTGCSVSVPYWERKLKSNTTNDTDEREIEQGD